MREYWLIRAKFEAFPAGTVYLYESQNHLYPAWWVDWGDVRGKARKFWSRESAFKEAKLVRPRYGKLTILHVTRRMRRPAEET